MFKVIIDDMSKKIYVTEGGELHGLSIDYKYSSLLRSLSDGSTTLRDIAFESEACALLESNGLIHQGLPRFVLRCAAGAHLKRVQIELLRECNLKCTYCYNSSGPAIKERIPWEVAERVLEDADRMGCIWVDLTGGEFFLYKDWHLAMRLCSKLGFVTTIHTNGTYFPPGAIEANVANSLGTVQISLDSHISGDHDGIRGVPGSHKRMVKNAKILMEKGVGITLCIMVSKVNISYVGEMIEWARKELPACNVKLDRILPIGRGTPSGIGVSSEDYYNSISRYLPQVARGKICAGEPTDPLDPHCGVGMSFVYITAAGEMALCPTMTSRENDLFSGPNLSDQSLGHAWMQNEYFKRFRGFNCKNVKICPSGPECRGGCRSNAYTETGDYRAPDQVSCNKHKNTGLEFKKFIYA